MARLGGFPVGRLHGWSLFSCWMDPQRDLRHRALTSGSRDAVRPGPATVRPYCWGGTPAPPPPAPPQGPVGTGPLHARCSDGPCTVRSARPSPGAAQPRARTRPAARAPAPDSGALWCRALGHGQRQPAAARGSLPARVPKTGTRGYLFQAPLRPYFWYTTTVTIDWRGGRALVCHSPILLIHVSTRPQSGRIAVVWPPSAVASVVAARAAVGRAGGYVGYFREVRGAAGAGAVDPRAAPMAHSSLRRAWAREIAIRCDAMRVWGRTWSGVPFG